MIPPLLVPRVPAPDGRGTPRQRRRVARPAAAAALVAVLAAAGAAGAGGPGTAATPVAAGGYLVSTAPGAAAALAHDLRDAGVQVTRQLDGVGVLAVRTDARSVARLSADPRVTGVSRDRTVALQADTWSGVTGPGSLNAVTTAVGARALWAGGTGTGVDVALIDSGVTPVPGLDAPGKVLRGPDLSFDSQVPALRSLDGFGHGTHMAGIIAGRDASFSGPSDTTSFAGVAPGARVVSVKVADAYGNADVSQIIAGIDWVVEHRRDAGMNIRVLNLSVGLPSQNGYQQDPLAHAAEQAWLQGIVVVASAGNDGDDDGQLLSPAYDPYVVAVGASDDQGTASPSDDVVSDFSSRGTAGRTPDVLAPGRSVASLRVPGSYLDQQYPGAVVGGRFFRGSGTSQAAAVVSGAAALLVQRNPSLSPDQVKGLLRTSAAPLAAAPATAQGKGAVRASAAAADRASWLAQTFPRSNGSGSLDAARGGYRVESGGVALTGERDVFGARFSSSWHATQAATTTAWSGGTWNGSTWAAARPSADGSWGAVTWSGTDWAGRSWTADRASAAVSWDGRSWAGGYWNGRSWAGRSWAGRSWATGSWG